MMSDSVISNGTNNHDDDNSIFDFISDLNVMADTNFEKKYVNEDYFNLTSELFDNHLGFSVSEYNTLSLTTIPRQLICNIPIETRHPMQLFKFCSESDNTFSLSRYNPPKLSITSFQRSHEPRIKYLLRSIDLWQEFMNSGDLDKLHILFKDIFSENYIILNDNKFPPIMGLHKLCDVSDSLLRNIPDYCIFYSNITRSKRRVIMMKAKSFGTLPYANIINKNTFLWDIFENTSIDKLDQHHVIQKMKYDALKSQKKCIKFETSVTLNIVLNRANHQIEKMSFGVLFCFCMMLFIFCTCIVTSFIVRS